MYLVLYYTVHLSIWFQNLVLFMCGFWLWLLFLLLIDFLLPFLIYSYLSVFILACCVEKCLSSFYVRLVPGMWKVSVMWLSLYFVSGYDLGLLMVRGHKGSPLWPMASPWNNLDGVYVSISVWSITRSLLLLS